MFVVPCALFVGCCLLLVVLMCVLAFVVRCFACVVVAHCVFMLFVVVPCCFLVCYWLFVACCSRCCVSLLWAGGCESLCVVGCSLFVVRCVLLSFVMFCFALVVVCS